MQTCKFNCSCPAIYIHIPTVFVFYESKLSFSAYHLWHMDVHWTLCAELKIISTLKNKVSVHSLFNCVASQQKKKKKKHIQQHWLSFSQFSESFRYNIAADIVFKLYE